MIKATQEDKTLVVKLLAKSFKENQSVNYIIQQDGNKLTRIAALMEYSFEMCFHFGEVWLSEDRKACALILFPQLKHTTILTIWLDIVLIVKAIGLLGVSKAMRRETQIKKLQPDKNMLYLWFIGVDPLYQHRGTGSILLAEIITSANNHNLPVYLETSTMKNLPWYERSGFEIYNQLELGYTLFFLKYEPAKD